MTTDTEGLILKFEARVTDFERAVKKIDRDIAKMAGRAQNENRQIARSADRAAAQMEKSFSTRNARLMAQFGKLRGAAGQAFGALGAIGVGGVAGLGAFGATGFVAGINEAARAIVDLRAEARRAGVAFEDFQRLKFAGEQQRVGIDALTDGLKELQLRADEFIVTGKGSAAEAFQRLGFSATELKRALEDPVALFDDILGRLAQLDKAAQIRISDELFGGTGGEQFVQILGSVQQFRDDMQKASVHTDETAKKAEEVNRQFNEMADIIGQRVREGLVDIGRLVDNIGDKIAGWATAAREFYDVARQGSNWIDRQLPQPGAYYATQDQWADFLRGQAGLPAGPAPGRGPDMRGEVSADYSLPTTGAHVDTAGLQDRFESQLGALLGAAAAAGHDVAVSSGFRSVERQRELWEAAVKRYGSESAARKWVAPPGRSNHNAGMAADLRFGGDAARQWIHQNAGQFGLHFPMGHEPWHVEPMGPGGSRVRGLNAVPQPADRTEITRQRAQEAERDVEMRARQAEAIAAVNAELARQLELAGLEAELMANTNLTREEVAAAVDQHALLQQKVNELESAGVVVTDEMRAALEAKIAKLYELQAATDQAATAQERLAESQAQMQDAFAAVGQPIVDTFMSIIDGSQKAEDAIKGLIKQLAQMVLQAALFGQGPLGNLFGGGIFKNLFSGGIPGRAAGGPVSAGGAYMVGEQGRELFVPNTSGRIINAAATQSMMRGGGAGGGRQVSLVVNVEGANGDAHVQSLVRQGVASALSAYDRQLQGPALLGRINGAQARFG